MPISQPDLPEGISSVPFAALQIPSHPCICTLSDDGNRSSGKQPVDVIRVLAKYGVSLKKASSVLDRLASGQVVPVELRASNSKEAVSELNSLGVFASEIREPKIEPKQVRSAYKLSQSDFATMYGFELDTLQNWEQGRNPPDFIARVFLKIIQRNPHLVMQILTEGENLSWPGNQIGTRRDMSWEYPTGIPVNVAKRSFSVSYVSYSQSRLHNFALSVVARQDNSRHD